MFNRPLAYFITFRTYGTWLHGDARGSVDRQHNQFGAPMLAPNDARVRFEASELACPPVELCLPQREVVAVAIRGVCEHRSWVLHALNARSNHVHVVVAAAEPPETVMNTFKSWATRRLREAGFLDESTRPWSRHGSTIYLFRAENLAEKVHYVLHGQDRPG